MKVMTISFVALALVLAAAAGAATTRYVLLRSGDKVAIPKLRLVCLVAQNSIACGSVDHPHSFNAVTDRRGVAITNNGKVIFLRHFK